MVSTMTSVEPMKIPEGYKQTEVGVIPNEWMIKALETLGNGNTPPIKAGPFGSSLTKDTYVSSGYKVYGQEQVIKGDHRYGDYYITALKYRDLYSCAVKTGDILLSLVGTTGKLLIISPDAQEGVINPRLLRFSFDKKIVNSEFFKFLFESEFIQNLLSRSAQGGTMAVLNAGMLRTLEIPLPSIKEQTAIANALSDVDNLIASLETLIAKKSAIKTAAMQQLLTGKKRLPAFVKESEKQSSELDNVSETAQAASRLGYKQSELGEIPEDWEAKKMGDVFSLLSGISFSGEFFSSKGPILLTPGNFKLTGGLYFEERNTKRYSGLYTDGAVFEKGDLLIVMTDLTSDCNLLGKPAFIETDETILHNQRIGKLKGISKEYSRQFLYYSLLAPIYLDAIKETATGSTVRHTSNKSILSAPILLPSSKEEQTAIAKVLSDMDTELDALQQRLSKTQKIKQGMMQELLTGKTRLV